jgi:hypothetical protein
VQQEISKRRRIILLLLVACTSLAVVSWFALKYTSDRPMAFDKTQWLQARNEYDSRVLSRMAKDLIERKALIGESRSQLVELLGAPEQYSDSTDREMYYVIREDWDGIDPVRLDHLLISLDQDGRAFEARVDVFRKKQHR